MTKDWILKTLYSNYLKTVSLYSIKSNANKGGVAHCFSPRNAIKILM